MRSVVFGGAGFLGSYLCEELLASGHSVTVFENNLTNLANIDHIRNKVVLFEGEFTNPRHVMEVLDGAEVVFHLISTTNPQKSNADPSYDIESNVLATISMLEASKVLGVKKVIFFSSGGTIYGRPQHLPINEDHDTNPICSYGIQKLMIEKYLYLYEYLYGLNYAVLRIANPYGPRQSPFTGQGVIAAFINSVLHHKPIEIWGDGSVIRDYIFAEDVAKAALAVTDYNGNERIFNIGSGKEYSLLDVVKSIELHIDGPLEVNFKPSRALDVPVNYLCISKAQKELLWNPKTMFEDGISATIDYMKRNK